MCFETHIVGSSSLQSQPARGVSDFFVAPMAIDQDRIRLLHGAQPLRDTEHALVRVHGCGGGCRLSLATSSAFLCCCFLFVCVLCVFLRWFCTFEWGRLQHTTPCCVHLDDMLFASMLHDAVSIFAVNSFYCVRLEQESNMRMV